MSSIAIVGGVYRERCTWPQWDQLVGSGGRAAAVLKGHVRKVVLHSYALPEVTRAITPLATNGNFAFHPAPSSQIISFNYVHCLSAPSISPPPNRIVQNDPIIVSAANILRFGMIEGTAKILAKRCVYDPQSAFDPEPFEANGSSADELAIVGNRGEIASLGGKQNPIPAAKALIRQGAKVVVIKAGAHGAHVVDASTARLVPAFDSGNVWTIGSGDVFAAIFAACWMVRRLSAYRSAMIASRAVAVYAGSMSLPSPSVAALEKQRFKSVISRKSKVYLAGPFFTIAQRWLVDEARRCLQELGAEVFSPVHDVGHGPAQEVAKADLAALHKCDSVFAILDGLDSGTVFEVGYARALKKPVYAFAQTVSDEELKMVEGSGCIICPDFVTALHKAAWRA